MVSIAVIALASTLVIAGQSDTLPVVVDINPDLSGSAFGDMVTARTSKNKYAIIGCGIKGFYDGVSYYEYGFCQADVGEDDLGTQYVVCFTENSDLMDIIKGISDYSYIRFDFDSNDTCTRIDISTQSVYLPKNVKANKGSK